MRDVVERIDVDALAAQVEADLRDEPAYRRFVHDDQLEDRGRSVIRWNLELFGRWLVDGQAPSEEDLARIGDLIRIRAEEGLPIEDGLQVYRRGARIGWEALLRLSSGEARLALLEGSAVYVAYVDLVADAFLAAYAERGRALVPDETVARGLLERLRAGNVAGAAERHEAERLGVALDGPLRPLAITVPGAPLGAHVERAARLRAAGILAAVDREHTPSSGGRDGDPGRGGEATPTVPGTVLALVAGPLDDRLARVRGTDVAGAIATETVFAEGPPTDPADLDAALVELKTLVALGAAAGRRGRVVADDFLVPLLLRQAPAAAVRIERRVLDGLDDELVATLRALVEHDFDRAATAAALPVHRNTLRARIGRIEQRTGLDLARTHDRGLVWLAVGG